MTADTNVYISAFNYPGKQFEILQLVRAGEIELAISEPILAEVRRILAVKFRWPAGDVAEAELSIVRCALMVDPKQFVDAVIEDPTDNRILECALESHSDYVISGDKHLLKIGHFGESRIVTATEFLNGFRLGS